ncbi:GAF and ANTAR domain-containing protein [Microlunatus soli]|uniref:GAF domain-containing protein n=1 Tax=Microlunatus soli TaxID=630515 RepID=A0A1H1N861_9ACTN|nr:GAF and ANTAR domain-containing protein [Microlunatus soli]SDR95164.1 GAF domain-containing protein [Microlunatus soli]
MTFQEFSLSQADDFAQLAAQLLAEQQEQPTLARIVTSAVQTVDACDYCSISLHDTDGNLTVPASTGPIAEQAMTLHNDLNEGPGLDTTPALGILNIDDVAGDHRWSQWGPTAAGLGVGSMLGIHLETARPTPTATLNLFAEKPHAFDATDLAVAGIFARLAATAINTARHEEGLRAAALSRQTIGIAQGLLMQRFGLTIDQSFELLRRYSADRNIKLRVLAERLADTGGIPTVGNASDSLEQAFGLRPPDRDPA